MDKFKARIANFMYGRYGIDQLYYGLLAVSFLLILINMAVQSQIINIVMYLILALLLFRAFSKNLTKRRRENALFLNYWRPVQIKLARNLRRIREVKTHRYRTCPKCKKVLRLSRKTGTHSVRCPSCQTEFKVRILI
ncbi:MAG: hypothetical protein LLG09_06185 [Negativicutes bacterium]|nr:hypothetical protein [Negativicutes bacterium]